MGPQWHQRADRQNSLLGHSGCRVGGNDLDIALAFKCLMPLLGMGGETEKGIALPILPWWNAVAINDVPAKRFLQQRQRSFAERSCARRPRCR
jgi:hypothetical chaperone protein